MAKDFTAEELRDFLLQKAQEAKSATVSRKILFEDDQRSRATTIVGRMFFFKYDPKGKKYLPKYDRFPLVVVLERQGGSFFGINLHYLDTGSRLELIYLFDKYNFKNNNLDDESTKLLINYDKIKSIGPLHNMAHPAYKRYLFNHCRSKFIEMYADEYSKAASLPVENWYIRP